jgi:hypothetical protein
MISNIITGIIFFPTMIIVAGLCAYASLWACAFVFGFGGNPTKGLKLGKKAQEKLLNKGGK